MACWEGNAKAITGMLQSVLKVRICLM